MNDEKEMILDKLKIKQNLILLIQLESSLLTKLSKAFSAALAQRQTYEVSRTTQKRMNPKDSFMIILINDRRKDQNAFLCVNLSGLHTILS